MPCGYDKRPSAPDRIGGFEAVGLQRSNLDFGVHNSVRSILLIVGGAGKNSED